MITEKIPQISGLNSNEKLLLINELWEDLSRNPEAIPTSEATLNELDRRMEAYENGSDPGKPWNEVKKGILDTKQ